jgi:hypothetical protein
MANKGFLNTNTAIMQQLIRTARMLEAEWWQVCGERLCPVLAWHPFWNLRTIYFFNFPNFFLSWG